jgi:ABC-type transporter Mla MlaB component
MKSKTGFPIKHSGMTIVLKKGLNSYNKSDGEVCMTIRMAGTVARLEGDWTLSGVTRNLDSLALSLQQLESGSGKKLRIDCGQMEEADISGLQLLNVWMQCVRFRGVEPTLVNVPEKLRHVMQILVGYCLMDTCLKPHSA